jgi:diphthamide biosynthesis protein 7
LFYLKKKLYIYIYFFNSQKTSIVVSQSDGSIVVLSIDNQFGIRETSKWIAHDFEAWIAAFNYWDTNLVYTGWFHFIYRV